MRLLVYCILLILIQKGIEGNVEVCDGTNMCIQKCCRRKHYISSKTKDCVALEEDLNFSDVIVKNKNLEDVGHLGDFFTLKPGAFVDEKYKNMSRIYRVAYKSFHLIEDGSMLAITKDNGTDTYPPGKFCLDYIIRQDSRIFSAFFRLQEEEVQENDNKNKRTLISIGLIISAIFLVLVLVVYSLLPELRSLGGLVLMAYVVSLLLAFLILFAMQNKTAMNNVAECLSLTYLSYYFLLASFFWMTVMSYDIFWTFRGYAKARPINRRGEHFKFCMYCIYAWGAPLLMTIILAVLNECADRLPKDSITPDIPHKGCFLDKKAQFVYMYIPMLIMIIINWLLFLMTVFNIWRLSRGASILTSGDSSATGTASAHRAQRQRLMVYFKLSIVMGLNWILEVASTFNPKFEGWYLSDAYNALIGLIIFLIFVCKKKIFRMLKKRFSGIKLNNFSSSPNSRSRSTRSTFESNSQTVPLKALGSVVPTDHRSKVVPQMADMSWQ